MLKFLVVLVVVGIGVWSLLSRLRGPGGGAGKVRQDSKPGTVAPQEVVPCAHCGLHLPSADAVTDGALHYCGDAHRRLGPAQPPLE